MSCSQILDLWMCSFEMSVLMMVSLAAHPLWAGRDNDNDGTEAAIEVFRGLHLFLCPHRLQADQRVSPRSQANSCGEFIC